MSYTIPEEELNRAFNALEKKVHQCFANETGEINERLKELEQRSVGGVPSTGSDFTKQFSVHSGMSFAKAMQESDSVKAVLSKQSPKGKAQIDAGLFFKNTILGEGGSPQNPVNTIVEADRLPGVVPGAFRSLSLLDMIPKGATTSNQIEYTREAAFTNDAAETAEGATKPESDNTFELVEDPVRTIAHWIKTSRQVWDDSAWLQGFLNDRMVHGTRARLQSQIINGDGTGSNLAGITSSGRHTAFTPETGDTELDSLNRCKYLIQAADYEPDFIMMNPADVGRIERLKRGSDVGYLLADGKGVDYVSTGLRGMIWELPVLAVNDLAAGKFIMGTTSAMRLIMRQEATAELFEQDGDNVVTNKLTLRAELRAALAILVPVAIRYGDLTV